MQHYKSICWTTNIMCKSIDRNFAGKTTRVVWFLCNSLVGHRLEYAVQFRSPVTRTSNSYSEYTTTQHQIRILFHLNFLCISPAVNNVSRIRARIAYIFRVLAVNKHFISVFLLISFSFHFICRVFFLSSKHAC